jgi:hypothetical protein
MNRIEEPLACSYEDAALNHLRDGCVPPSSSDGTGCGKRWSSPSPTRGSARLVAR